MATADGSTYKGGGKDPLKSTITIKATSGKIVSYDVSIETLCGKVNLGGKQTAVWPVTPNAGEAPLKVKNGAFSGKQHQSTTIPAIPGVTTEPEPGTYSFSISGKFNKGATKVEGHVSLYIETTGGYFCTATRNVFVATRKK